MNVQTEHIYIGRGGEIHHLTELNYAVSWFASAEIRVPQKLSRVLLSLLTTHNM